MTSPILAVDAVVAYLAAHPGVLEFTTAALVFGRELPEGEAEAMPRPCLVVQEASGPGGGGDLPLDAQRVDVNAYGETTWAADRLAYAAHLALKALRRVTVSIDQPDGPAVRALVHSATPAGGFIAVREPGLPHWPRTLRSYLVLHDERAVA